MSGTLPTISELCSRTIDNAEAFSEWLKEAGTIVRSLPDRNQAGNERTNTHNSKELWQVADRLHELVNEHASGAAERCTEPGRPRHFNKTEVLGNIRHLRSELGAIVPGADHDQGGAGQAEGEAGQPLSSAPSTGTVWLTVSKAARVAGCNPGEISRAVTSGKLKSNGESGRLRRIDAADLSLWQLRRAEREEPTESDEAVERKLKRRGD
jgi:hypothetical protein